MSRLPPFKYALIDCDNFYCSCERIFNPKLARSPLVILSSNDGCIIARSQEAKAIGIPMGAPVFSVRHALLTHRVHIRSSNFSLYGDISARVMSILRQHTSCFEMYSIDEAFLMLEEGICTQAYLKSIQEQIYQWVGVPISIGVGYTKTLAKMATHIAKKEPEHGGVYDLTREPLTGLDARLKATPTASIWGIGERMAKRLKAYHVCTAYDLKYADSMRIAKIFGVMGQRLIHELNNRPAVRLEEIAPAKKHISTARSLGHPIEDKNILVSVLADYIARIVMKLRAQDSLASGLCVGLSTNHFDKTTLQYHPSAQACLPSPSDYTPDFMTLGRTLFESIYKPGYPFKKVKAMLYGIIPRVGANTTIFDNAFTLDKQTRLMQVIDQMNNHFQGTPLRFASMSQGEANYPRSAFCSPSYTTSWEELLTLS